MRRKPLPPKKKAKTAATPPTSGTKKALEEKVKALEAENLKLKAISTVSNPAPVASKPAA